MKNLPKLQSRPVRLQEKVFEKLFSEAELAKLTPDQKRTYEESLKVYRDNKNTMDYAIKTAVEAAVEKAVKAAEKAAKAAEKRAEKQRLAEKHAIVRELKKNGVSVEVISNATGLTREEIEKL